MVKFYFTQAYNQALERIEDFIFNQSGSLEQVEGFWSDHDRLLEFIKENPRTPATHPSTGDQSWVFGDGRYRVFFKTVKANGLTTIYLTHIIDNRQANLEIYPNNTLPTYDED